MSMKPPGAPSRRLVLQGASAAALLGACNGTSVLTDDKDTDTGTGPVDSDTDAPIDTAPDEPVALTFDPVVLAVDEVTFPWSVQAGAMRPRSAILLTKVVVEPRVMVRVWIDDGNRERILLEHEVIVDQGVDGFTRVEVDGLQPGQRHAYAWFRIASDGTPEARSAIGRFRTPPTPDTAAPFTLALCACNGGATRRQDAFGRIADHDDVDAIVHVGDMAYNDTADDLRSYRSSWQEWMTSEGYRAALASAGLYATWDDHEVGNNYDPETLSPGQKAAAFQAFVENVAVEPGEGGRLWQSYRWGSTAELLVLDCRSERQPSTRGGDDVYVSRAQLDWLKTRLRDSPATFKLVLNSVPITNMPTLWDFAADDRWEGYPSQRDELLDWIRDQDIADVWFLTGDFHVCFVGKVQRTGQGRLDRTWEIATTSGNVNPLGDTLRAPQFPYGVGSARLTLVSCDPSARTVTVRMIDPETGEEAWSQVMSQGTG
ncbi:MAG: alkaline phosphatase D family protein [Alphaproteobacteria bacterium]|nr:alkaline phosphatase D family protein [Alphaproteobacteria bacterium]